MESSQNQPLTQDPQSLQSTNVSQSPNQLPSNSTSNKKKYVYGLLVILTIIVVGSIISKLYIVREKTDSSDVSTNIQYNSENSERILPVSPAENTSTETNTSTDDWAIYVSHVEEPGLLALTRENQGQIHPDNQTAVPFVLEEGINTQVVYTDFGQTMLTIPKGWYGQDGDQKNGVFRDFEHKLLLRIGFSETGKSIETTEQIMSYLNSDQFQQALGANASNVLIAEYDSDHVLMDVTKIGGGYIIYRITPNNPTYLHKTTLTAADETSLTKEQIEALLKKIITSEKVIGIDPTIPNERIEFLAAHNILAR